MKNARRCLLFFSPFMAGCVQKNQQPAPKPLIFKISVLSSGAILLDGGPTNLQDLGQVLKSARNRNGQVWYYREGAQSGPPKEATEVIKLIVEANLPVSFSSKPDFSDYVDEQGQSHPRPKQT